MDLWEIKESELLQKHEELLVRREALLRGTETYYNAQDGKPSSFIADYSKAMQRNEQLRNDVRTLSENLRRETEDEGIYRDFHTLKHNYWAMVRNTFPIWYEDQQQYEQKYGSPRSNYSGMQSNTSPRLSNRSQAVNGNFPVPRSPRVSQSSPRMTNRSPRASPRPHSSRYQSHETIENVETLTVPPLELDFSMGDDLTTASQLSASAFKHKGSATTPKSALASSSSKAKNKKVQIKEDKKVIKEQKRADEKAAKFEKERRKRIEKENKKEKKDSVRSKNDSAKSDKSQ